MKHRCIVCKRKRGTKGVSFHRFPKDENQLFLWLLNLNKENCPSLSSLICSRHFEAECLEPAFNRVRLKKGSVPTIFTEQSYSSIELDPLSCNTLIESDDCYMEGSKKHIKEITETNNIDVTPHTKVEPLINPHGSYVDSFETHVPEVTGTNSTTTTPYIKTELLIESDGSYSEEIVDFELDIPEESGTNSMNTTHCIKAERLVEPSGSCMENFKTHVPEVTKTNSMVENPCVKTELLIESAGSYTKGETSNMDLTSCTQSWQQVHHDHQYTYSSKNYKEKFQIMRQQIRELRQSKRILGQKVKRLQGTIAALEQMVIRLHELILSILEDTQLELLNRIIRNIKMSVVSKQNKYLENI